MTTECRALDLLKSAKGGRTSTHVVIPVALLAFGSSTVREVEIPISVWERATNGTTEKMELVFHYGQNDFVPVKGKRSVSVGDFFLMAEAEYPSTLRLWEVADWGFAERGLVYKRDLSFVF